MTAIRGADPARLRRALGSALLTAMTIPGGRPLFVCPCCGARSAHPDDLANGYCGACHDWTVGELAAAHMAGPCAARGAFEQ